MIRWSEAPGSFHNQADAGTLSVRVVELLLLNRFKERGSKNNRFTLLHQGQLASHSTNNPKTDWNGNLFRCFFDKWNEDVLGVLDFMLQGRLDRNVYVLVGFEALDGDLPILSHYLGGIVDDIDQNLDQDCRVHISEGESRGETISIFTPCLLDFRGHELDSFIYDLIYRTLLRAKLNRSEIVLDPL